MELKVPGFEWVEDPSSINEGADYILLLYFHQDHDIEIGALGRIHLQEGTYAYCGSAKAGLWGRVRRHLSDPLKKRWHIDYITGASEKRMVLWKTHSSGGECEVARNLSKDHMGVRGFGCSDCKCASHLFYLGEGRINR